MSAAAGSEPGKRQRPTVASVPDDVCDNLRRVAQGSAIRRAGKSVAQVIFRGGIEVFLRFEVIRTMPDLVQALSDVSKRKPWEDAYGRNVVRVVVSDRDGFVIATDGALRDSVVTIIATTAADVIAGNCVGTAARKKYEGYTFFVSEEEQP